MSQTQTQTQTLTLHPPLPSGSGSGSGSSSSSTGLPGSRDQPEELEHTKRWHQDGKTLAPTDLVSKAYDAFKGHKLQVRVDSPGWMDVLDKEGWVVIPGVLSPEKAAAFVDGAHGFLESFELGYKRDDPATWRADKLPFSVRGGIFNRGGLPYQQFMWDIKQDPAVYSKWELIWGTKELVASYDAANISLPMPLDPADVLLKPWPHVDQSPLCTDLYSVQGLINMLPNGPEDGGFLVLKGSKRLYAEFFRAFAHQAPEGGWSARDRYDHTPEQIQWFLDRGCAWEKVCLNPGDMVLFDSRSVHYGAVPKRAAERMAVYVCYKPAAFLTPEIKERRRAAWEKREHTSHDPITFWTNSFLPPPEHHSYDAHKAKMGSTPEPQLTQRGRQLAGLDEY